MYENPVLFPAVTNREGWLQFVTLNDDDTGDLIPLADSNNNALYTITLEISAASPKGDWCGGYGQIASPYYDCDGAPIIEATLSNYLSIVDVGTIQIQIPKSVMTTLPPRTYDVFMTIDPNGQDDGRQLFVGRIPVLFGGRNT